MRNFFKYIIILLFFRLASIIYGFMHLKRRYYSTFILLCLVSLFFFSTAISDFVLAFNDSDMVLRKFDAIPTFQNFGELGILFRAIAWPVLAVSGTFVVVSPALEYLPVALGSVFTQMYCYLMSGKFQLPIGLLLALIVFAVLVTGFTAYIRYIYPLLTVIPIVAFKGMRRQSVT